MIPLGIRWVRLHRLDLMTPPQIDCEQMVVNLTACDFWSQTLGSSRAGTITARGRKEKSDGAFSEAVMSHILPFSIVTGTLHIN